MNNASEVIRNFLENMGVVADVRIDKFNRSVIVIENDEFFRRQAWIESWFTLVDQDDTHSYFYERPRGTGQTM